MQAMTTGGARRVPAPQRPPFLFGAKEASAGEEYRGIMGKQRRPRLINFHMAPKAAGCWGPRRVTLAPSLLY